MQELSLERRRIRQCTKTVADGARWQINVHIPLASQPEALSTAEFIGRKRLGGSANRCERFPERSKRMQWRTYLCLRAWGFTQATRAPRSRDRLAGSNARGFAPRRIAIGQSDKGIGAHLPDVNAPLKRNGV